MSALGAQLLGQASPCRTCLKPQQFLCRQQASPCSCFEVTTEISSHGASTLAWSTLGLSSAVLETSLACFVADTCKQLGGFLCQQLVSPWQEPRQRFGGFACQAVEANGVHPSTREEPDGAANGNVAVAVRHGQGRVLDTDLRVEVEKSYLSYAMSVIVGRALPDVRDGLKPVHRRILFAMHDLGLMPNKPFRKSARVVGEVLGKYHPHGDTAVYDALVRLAQPFSMRLPLIDGHGNFGSLDNDPAAAMRYTECRLQRASTAALLADLELNTVDFFDTFDGAQQEPIVLPARLPALLINGSQGIAVGMATNIPPHNVHEVVSALEALIQNPDITTLELMTHLPAPDFPTGGEIIALNGMETAYSTGRGPITVRGRATIEDDEMAAPESAGRRAPKRGGSTKPSIVITELPYQTNKASLVKHIAKLTDDGVLQGISDVRDESDREGMRVAIEIKRGFNPEVILNNLYKHTLLQKQFNFNLVALVNGSPRTLGLKDILSHFLDFRCQVVTRRAQFELGRAEKRAHIVEGLLKAQGDLDSVVVEIRKARDGPAASQALQQDFGLSAEQADAVLGMALRRLTSMEAGKLQQEHNELQASITAFKDLLGSEEAIRRTVAKEARELVSSLGDERRTLVRRDVDGLLQQEDIIPNRQSLVVFSKRGYIKRMAADFFSTQGRGGKGQKLASLRDNDGVEEMQIVRDHQSILFFTTDGQTFHVKAYQIPQASRTAAGTTLHQVLKLQRDQKVTGMLPIDDFGEDTFLVMLTKKGLIKRIMLNKFSKLRSGTGLTGMKLAEGDELIWVRKCRDEDDIMLATTEGKVVRYAANLLRPLGRTARGVSTLRPSEGVSIVGMTVLPHQIDSSSDSEDEGDEGEESEDSTFQAEGLRILFATEKGNGKQVPAELFKAMKGRTAQRGLIGIRLQEDDRLAAFHVVSEEREVLISTRNGLMTRTSLDKVPVSGRRTRGVILMRTKEETDKIKSVSLIDPDEEL